MVRSQLIREVARRTGYTITVSDEIVRATFDTIMDEMEGHGDVNIPNFGTFCVITRKGRLYKMPDGGNEVITIDRKYPCFKSAPTLRERVK